MAEGQVSKETLALDQRDKGSQRGTPILGGVHAPSVMVRGQAPVAWRPLLPFAAPDTSNTAQADNRYRDRAG